MRFILATLFLAVVPGFSAQQPDRPLPLFFFPNTGQADSSTQYIVQTPELSGRFRPGEAIFKVHQQQIAVRFVGANPAVSIAGQEPMAGKVNFFLGTAAWKTDVPSFAKVVYLRLYPGIDMTYGGTGRQLKSEFLVGAGADPGLIRLWYSEPISIDAEGNLIAGDLFREDAPEIYQQIGPKNVKIAGRYRLLDQHTVGFEISPYDTSLPLVIDPTISYCSYLGGSTSTAITGIALDSGANLYMTGWTEALNFPIDGAYQAANAGGVDVIVAKLSATGAGLLYATYIGGRADDKGAAIAVDNFGQAYVTGSTTSSNFPLVSSNRPAIGGSVTAFVLKLNAAGNTLLYSGYLGGTTWEVGNAIAVDSSYNAYIAGDTQSPDFPTKNGTQTVIGGSTDAFVTKLNSTGGYAFSTFLGGTGVEHAGGIAVDSLGDIFVAGGTSSSNFPVVSALQGNIAGTQNAFVTKYSYAGTVAFSTYLGGSGGTLQQANAIALDSAGNPYIAGVTNSVSFPVTSGAFQSTFNGIESAFVTKMTANGSAFGYSTYLGGDVSDWASGIAVSAAGNAYVAGWTSSVNFPQSSPVQAAFGGLTDAFISEFNFVGNGLLFSTYYGGSGSDSVTAIALDSNANIFTGGQTASPDLPLLNPIESTTLAPSTGWYLRLGVSGVPVTTPSVISVSPTSGTENAVVFTGAFADTGGGSTLTSAALLLNTNASTGSGCYVSYNPGTNLFSLYNDAGTAVLATVAPGGATISNDQCELSGIGSSATVSGTLLTVTFFLMFQPSFAGTNTVYLQAGDAHSTTGWLAEGTFTVGPPVCTYQLGSNEVTVSAAAGNYSAAVTAPLGCAWTAVSTVNWIGITSGAGTGNGTLMYTVAANGGGYRSTELGISGQGFAVNQLAPHAANITDFDGDGKADLAIYRPSTGWWSILPSSTRGPSITASWGIPGDISIVGDFDGDKVLDFAVYRPSNGTWYIIPSSTGVPYAVIWGLPGDVPIAADYDGDGKTDPAVWRPSNQTWYVIPSSNPSVPIVKTWGIAGDQPVQGDFDGDGKKDFAVFRPSTGAWYIIRSSTGVAYGMAWGIPGDEPVPADFDGDGKTDLAVYRSSAGTWYVIPSSTGIAISHNWGVPGDQPLLLDYDGDHKTDFTIYRPSTQTWYVIQSSTGTVVQQQYGLPNDIPLYRPWPWQ